MKTFRLALVCMIIVVLGAVASFAFVSASAPTAQAAPGIVKVAGPCHGAGC